MEKPLVDILVPTYQPDPGFLRQALDSMLSQRERRWTCVINDDASTINVGDMVESYLKDSRFSFHRNQKRLGIGGNWNACLGAAIRANPATPFIQYLFQDDCWYANYLQQVLAVFEKFPDIGFVSSAHKYEYEPEMTTGENYEDLRMFKENALTPGSHDGWDMLRWWIAHSLHPNVIGEPSFVMLRRDVVRKVGTFSEDMPQFLDVDYWIRCLQRTNWHNLVEESGLFRVHKKGASFQNDQTGEGVFDRFRCIDRLITSLPHGPDRIAATNMRKHALKKMIWKFLDRLYNGKKISGKGSGALQRFCCMHPLLVGKATTEVIWERLTKTQS